MTAPLLLLLLIPLLLLLLLLLVIVPHLRNGWQRERERLADQPYCWLFCHQLKNNIHWKKKTLLEPRSHVCSLFYLKQAEKVSTSMSKVDFIVIPALFTLYFSKYYHLPGAHLSYNLGTHLWLITPSFSNIPGPIYQSSSYLSILPSSLYTHCYC